RSSRASPSSNAAGLGWPRAARALSPKESIMSVLTARRTAPGQATRPRMPERIGAAQTRAAWVLVLPFLLVFAAMFLAPLIYSLYLSLFSSQLVGGQVFAGLGNYIRAVQDPSFWAGLGRVGLFLLIQVPIMLVAAICFALALDSKRVRGGRVARLLVFVPYAVPSVVATLMWGYLYGTDFGLITQV